MPYFVKQDIKKRAALALLFVILTFTIFPIAWMVYNSFRGNNEIIEGKVGLERASTSVIFTQKDEGYIWIGTADGTISKYSATNKRLLDKKGFKTQATNFAISEDYIWLSSAGSGIYRIQKDNLKTEHFPIEWGEQLDINKVSRTMIVIDETRSSVYVSIGYTDMAKVVEYDLSTMIVSREYDILGYLPFSFDRTAISDIFKDRENLYVATNRGIVVLTLESKEFVRLMEDSDFAVNNISMSSYYDETDLIYAASPVNVYEIKQGSSIKKLYSLLDKDMNGQFTSLTVHNNKIYLGTAHGLMILSQKGQLLKNYNLELFDDVDKNGDLISEGNFVKSEVLSVTPYKGNIFLLGSSVGRLTFFDSATSQVIQTILSPYKGFHQVRWRNYVDLWSNIEFGLFFRNSMIVCFSTMFIAMIAATFTSYALVRFRFLGNNTLSMSILATQMIPGVMTLIPIYILFKWVTDNMGLPLINTLGGLIFVYTAFFLPFSVWILRSFFAAIPKDLEEAAIIDGCTPFQVFWKIALPLAVPGIIATGIYVFLVAWDELMFVWILTSDKSVYTIPAGIRLFVGNFQNRYDLLMAASTVATIPILIMFLFLQKQFVAGMTSGAVKE